MNWIHSAFLPIHIFFCMPLGVPGKQSCNHFLFTQLSLLLTVSCATLHLAQMHANTVSAREEWVFKLYLKNKCDSSELCVRIIPSLLSNHVSLKVKSCFLWSKNSRHIQLLRVGENSNKGNVLATEMRWKWTNMLRHSGIRDKSLIHNLPPPLTSASDLMA